MQIADSAALSPASEDAALQTLQSAIVRLATRPADQSTPQQRQEFNALVDVALKAYREYMKVVSH